MCDEAFPRENERRDAGSAANMRDSRRDAARRREAELIEAAWERLDREDLLRELKRTESEREAWERHGQEETFARERVERDLGIIIDNRNSQLEQLAKRLDDLLVAAEKVERVFSDHDPMFEYPCVSELRAAIAEAKG